jgi:hypothetical protein
LQIFQAIKIIFSVFIELSSIEIQVGHVRKVIAIFLEKLIERGGA